MSWTHALEQFVPTGSLSKGRNYFRSRAVEIGNASEDRVEATVKGGGWYSVVLYLNVGKETVVASCTCPHYEDINLCKHIWATVLAAESEGYLRRIAEMSNPSIETEIEYEGLDSDDDELGEDDDEWDEPRFYRDVAPPSKAKPAPIAPWKQHLSSVRTGAPAETFERNEGKRRIIYVADVSQSLSTGGLVIQAVASRLKKNGEWGKPAFQENSIRQVAQLDSSDQRILALLSGSGEVYSYYSYSLSQPESIRAQHRVPHAAQDFLVPLLCETERFYLKPAQSDALFPMEWDSGPPWSFKVQVQCDNAAKEYIVKGILTREGDEKPIAEPLLMVRGLVFLSDHVARLDDGNMFPWLKMLRTAGDLRVPFEHRNDFIREIADFPVLPFIELPEELRVEKLTLTNPPELKIRAMPESTWRNQQKLACWVAFDYAGVKVPGTPAAGSIHEPQTNRYYKRDLEAEKAALNRLTDLGFSRVTWEKHQWELSPSRLPAAVRALVAEGWRVEAEGKLYRRGTHFQMNVASGVDWFELHGRADFEGQLLEMPQLLRAVARGEHMVRLDDGTYGLVPEDWLKRYRLVAALGKSNDGQVRFERHQAGLLDALLAEQPEVTFDEGFVRVRQEIATFAGVRAVEEPATFQGRLREYQREGLGWIQFLRRCGFGGCLADDMGLGKTVQVLAFLDATERSLPSLIVVPRSLIFNWKQEVARFTPRLRVLDHTGGERMDRWNDIQNYDVILTTYGTLRRDAPLLKDVHFDTVVLDEAQAIKNANTDSAKAARLLKADYRLALTGTPVENRLGDLWSLFEFLNPGLLGTASVFRSQIGKKNGTVEPTTVADDDSLRILSKALRPFLLRRTKERVARELPAKTEQTIYCELERDQRRLYDELRDHYRNALLGRIDKVGIEKSRMQILEALLRLRQAACHPGLIDKERTDQSSAKLESLIPQIVELVEEGHKALVFSQFTSFLSIVRTRLAKEQLSYEYLDGRTRDREEHVRRFQEDDQCRLFLISLKAGGLGLNLTAAEYVFLLDPWWNPAVEAQAIDRTHRIGQSRNVFAYRLVARDTVEEKILDLQKTKRELADAIITADNAVLSGLSRENLELLLS
jgi:superfamily II DNA or RNA helicase